MAGFVQFDPDKWGTAKPAEAANREDKDASSVAALADSAGLAGALSAGVSSLAKLPAPPCVDQERWRMILEDAGLLFAGNWINQALELGWSELDLFGIAMPSSDLLSDGLAAWLNGRRLRALSADFAVVVGDGGGRSYFNLPRKPGARLLWDLGGAGAKVVPLRH